MACFLTFYSYKGGVGRSLALANVAWSLAERGKRVVVVDMDLEAPSLHDVPELRPEAGPDASGVMEYAAAYARLGRVPEISAYLHECPQPPGHGRLWIVPAGHLSAGYAEHLGDLRWGHLHAEHGSGPFVEGLRRGLEEGCAPHYVLVDSRTGLSDIGGLSTHRLADMVVLVFNLTPACLDGTVRAYRSMLREGSRVREAFLVASPVPPVVDAPGSVIQRRIDQAQRLLSPEMGRRREVLRIVYDPEMALAEELAVTQPRRFRAAAGVYNDLREAIQRSNPEELFSVQQEARELRDQGRTDEAVELLREVVEARPQDTDAHLALGGLLLTVGRPQDAASHLRRATELSPSLAVAQRKFGEALLAAAKTKDALQALTAAERAGDTSPDLPLALASAHRRLGHYKEAALALVPEGSQGSMPPEHLLELQAAFEQHAKASRPPPGVDLLGFCRALMGSLSLDNRDKAKILRSVLEDKLTTHQVRELIRILTEARTRFEGALGPCSAALQDRIARTATNPMDSSQLAELLDGSAGDGALALLLVGRQSVPDARLDSLRKGLAAEPTNPPLLRRHAWELIEHAAPDAERRIRARYEEAFEREPENADLAFDLGNHLSILAKLPDTAPEEARRLGREAIEQYRRAVDVEADKHEALHNWGLQLSALAELPDTAPEEARRLRREAIELCQCAVDVKPDKHEALYNWGLQLSKLSALPDTAPEEARRLGGEAIEQYRRAVDVEADKHEALFGWGVQLGALAELPDTAPEEARRLRREAIEQYQRAVDVKADKHEALYNWGGQLSELAALPDAAPEEARRLGEEAIEQYQRAVDVKADKHEALNNWGVQLSALAALPDTAPEEARRLGRQAIQQYQRAVDAKPDEHEALHNWGVQLSALAGLPDTTPEEARRLAGEAIELHQRAIDIKPDEQEGLNKRGFRLSALAGLPDMAPEEGRRLRQEAIEPYQRALDVKRYMHEALDKWVTDRLWLGYFGPADVPSRLDAALALRARRTEILVEPCQRAVDVRPDMHEALDNWAAQLLRLAHLDPAAAPARLEEALALLQRRAEIVGEPVERSYNYACVRARQGRKSEALASLEQVLGAGNITPEQVRGDPDWEQWAGDSELEELLARFEER